MHIEAGNYEVTHWFGAGIPLDQSSHWLTRINDCSYPLGKRQLLARLITSMRILWHAHAQHRAIVSRTTTKKPFLVHFYNRDGAPLIVFVFCNCRVNSSEDEQIRSIYNESCIS